MAAAEGTTSINTAATRSFTPEQSSKKKEKKENFSVIVARCIVDSTVVATLTTLCTIFALIAEDLKVLYTNKPIDPAFDICTLICVVVFSMEIILTTIGKSDYFLGFFFWLDLLATGTLILDLSWIAEARAEPDRIAGGGGDTSQLEAFGSKAGRIVRVVRLVRILKLYKAILAKLTEDKSKKKRAQPGDAEWEAMEEGAPVEELQIQSQVGKELSDLTIRRVICLVLFMMLVMPFLSIDSASKMPNSAVFGADAVYEAFQFMQANTVSPGSRTLYEDSVLEYVYFHNWFNTLLEECPYKRRCSKDHLSNLFWFGIRSNDNQVIETYSKIAALQYSTVSDYAQKLAAVQANEDSAWKYNYGSLPGNVQTLLGSNWTTSCQADVQGQKFSQLGIALLGEGTPGVEYFAECPDKLRGNEVKVFSPLLNIRPDAQTWQFVFYFDMRKFTRKEAFSSLMTTLFVCFALGTASMFFTNDANKLVLDPVESMIATVDKFRKDPLRVRKVADEEFAKELEKVKVQRPKGKCRLCCEKVGCVSAGSTVMETVVLEKTIIKLGSLLALGFGEAGTHIIAENMRGIDSASVNVMIEGVKVECILGAVRIKDFTVATEVLSADVMAFVNQCAEIVHGVVDEFWGAANKNTGDFFLVVWKFGEEEGVATSQALKFADMSMMACSKLLGSIHRSTVLAQYRKHPGLQQRLGHLPPFGKRCRVHMSMGLHYGWAIEGGVGSEFKVDASYLSPNVSVAESVERCAEIYDVSVMVAESVMGICSSDMASKCRLIDKVIITGSTDPIRLHALDLDWQAVEVDAHGPNRPTYLSTKEQYNIRQFWQKEKVKKLSTDSWASKFNENPDICAMRARYTQEFMYNFAMGYQNYAQGEWQAAGRRFKSTVEMLGIEDGPSKALLDYMRKRSDPHLDGQELKAPKDWDGVRVIDQPVGHDDII